MSEASLADSGGGHWDLAGPLDFSSVPQLWPTLEKALQTGPGVTLSLSGVSHANSAGLVMLVEALDLAQRAGHDLKLRDVPAELLDLAGMSGCDDLISANTL